MFVDPISRSALCMACRLCCDGTLFDFVRVDPDEEPVLASVGVEVVSADDDGSRGFCQPCPVRSGGEGGGCGCYAARPATCRKYSCVTLQDVDRGVIGLEEAHKRVSVVRAAAGAMEALIPAGQSLAAVLGAVNRGEAADPQLLLRAGVMNLLLDRHFRKAGRRRLKGTSA